jgi:hypothetical protein
VECGGISWTASCTAVPRYSLYFVTDAEYDCKTVHSVAVITVKVSDAPASSLQPRCGKSVWLCSDLLKSFVSSPEINPGLYRERGALEYGTIPAVPTYLSFA